MGPASRAYVDEISTMNDEVDDVMHLVLQIQYFVDKHHRFPSDLRAVGHPLPAEIPDADRSDRTLAVEEVHLANRYRHVKEQNLLQNEHWMQLGFVDPTCCSTMLSMLQQIDMLYVLGRDQHSTYCRQSSEAVNDECFRVFTSVA